MGQNFNWAGTAGFFGLAKGSPEERAQMLPALDVADIRAVDWAGLRAAGFKGCVFDKDNTLTLPYICEVKPELAESLGRCQAAFGEAQVAIFSNSAGLEQFDPDGVEAGRVEAGLGVRVLRHREKKPAGGKGDLERHFGCGAEELVMVGDRYLTDVVFGNRNGMFTIRVAPVQLEGEPVGVRIARFLEDRLVRRTREVKQISAPAHRLAGDDPARFLLPEESLNS